MQDGTIHRCQCSACRQPGDHPDKVLDHQMNLLLSRLDEQQRRWSVALESKKPGHGGDAYMSMVTGLHVQTIRRPRGVPLQPAEPSPGEQPARKHVQSARAAESVHGGGEFAPGGLERLGHFRPCTGVAGKTP